MLTTNMFSRVMDSLDCSPWGVSAGRQLPRSLYRVRQVRSACCQSLYTPDERRRRDESGWTVVQGILAPAQFAVFLVSLGLVLRFLLTGSGETAAVGSVVVKTAVLYTIMVTGSIWEHEVFGRYLFAPAFFWEDLCSMLVLALHTAYIAALLAGGLTSHGLMLLALAAYAAYVINAAQFLLKLRAARRQHETWRSAALGLS